MTEHSQVGENLTFWMNLWEFGFSVAVSGDWELTAVDWEKNGSIWLNGWDLTPVYIVYNIYTEELNRPTNP